MPASSTFNRYLSLRRIARPISALRQCGAIAVTDGLILAVTVEEVFMHCAKSMARSKIWQPDQWPDTTNVPTLAEGMVVHGQLAETTDEMRALIDSDFKTRMY
jgi:hypothetical protein